MSGNLSMDQKNKNKLILGCSVHSVEDAIEAEKLGASYLTAGHIFATDCKRTAATRNGILKQVCETVNIPVYAIGGIGLNDGKIDSVCECGAAGACIMSGLYGNMINIKKRAVISKTTDNESCIADCI